MKLSKSCLITFIRIMVLMVIATFASAENAMTTRAVPLKQAANMNSETIMELEKNQSVTIGVRQGAWYEAVISMPDGEIQGWLRMTDIRFEEAVHRPSGQSGLSILSNIFTGQTEQTVGTGVRGLDNEEIPDARAGTNTGMDKAIDEGVKRSMGIGVVREQEQLQNSQKNMSAVIEMERYAVSQDTARRFAEQGQLKTHILD